MPTTNDWILAGMTKQELIKRINLLGDDNELLKLYKKAWIKLYDSLDVETEEGWQLRELMDEVSQ